MVKIVGIAPTSAFCDGEVAPHRQRPWTQGLVIYRRRRCMMRVAVYVRVSTQRQTQTQTIEQQLERLGSYIDARGCQLVPVAIFRDEGYSGAQLAAPGLDRLRDWVARAEVDRVLITAPDRLARKYVHQVLLLEELERYGWQVEFLDRPMSQDPHDQLVLQIRGAVSEYERSL